MKKIYLDYAGTTPIDPRVLRCMVAYMKRSYGNPSSFHSMGQEAATALEESRETIAHIINAEPNEIVFTSSATESINLALKGVAFANRKKAGESRSGQRKGSMGKGKGHIVISSIEHVAVMETAKWLETQGFDVTRLPVDKYGLIKPEDVDAAIRKDTLLVSVMHANNEIGTIEPIKEIGRICSEHNVLFHTDAVQSFGKIPIDVKKMNIDLLSANAHKLYGPKGIGILYVRTGVDLEPLIHGGGQEFGLRSSTENVAAAVGFAKAAELAKAEMGKEGRRQSKLIEGLIKSVLGKIENSYLNGHPTKRLPNIANFRFDYIEGESLVVSLDLEGIATSTSSACSSKKLEPSHVLLAIGLKPYEAHGSLRISMGRFTKKKDINYTVKVLEKTVLRLRKLSPFKKGWGFK